MCYFNRNCINLQVSYAVRSLKASEKLLLRNTVKAKQKLLIVPTLLFYLSTTIVPIAALLMHLNLMYV